MIEIFRGIQDVANDVARPLKVFDDARREIADASTVEHVNRIVALATGLAAAVRKATDREVEAEAEVLKLEAQRQLRQLMQAQNENRKTTRYISKRQAMNLMEALKFASLIGCPLNVSVDISWLFFFGSVDDRTRFARCQQRLSKWTKRHGFPLTLIWTREVGKHRGINTHVLLHVRPWLMDNGDFERALERAFEPEGGPNHEKAIKIQPAPFPEGKLGYNLKGLHPKDAKELGVCASFQGDLEGKRVGCTENIES